MGSPTWLIEAVQYQNDRDCPQRLAYLLQELDCNVIVFDDEDLSFLDELKEGPVIFYGSINTLLDIRSQGKSLPGPFAWYDPYTFSCRSYYEYLSPFVLGKNSQFLTLSELREPSVITDIYERYGKDNMVFIRPDDNEKTFTGTLVRQTNAKTWLSDLIDRRFIPEKTEVVVSKPQKITCEWRFIMVDGKVASGSQYMTNSFCDPMEGYKQEAAQFAEEAALYWSPFPVYVMDIGEVYEEGFRVVEVGPFNYAGLYQSDIRAVAGAINNLFP